MKRIALGLAAILLTTASASAADLFAVAYGNTVTQTLPNGTKMTIYVNADKTWEQHMADGKVVKGTYAWKDDSHACFTETDPAPKDPSKATNCNEIKGDHKVGDTWTEPMGNGQNITMSITAGR
jgi:major membrane immunogen (membrane-anchored lipoprotein)